jgi:hypothetical protein
MNRQILKSRSGMVFLPVCRSFLPNRSKARFRALAHCRKVGEERALIYPRKAAMHLHGIQTNPYAALDALRSAQKTAARREADLVRKELLESASELAGESELSDACVVRLEARQESRKQPRRRNQQKEQSQPKREEPADATADDNHLSDWA